MDNNAVIFILVVFVVFIVMKMFFQKKTHTNTHSKSGLILSIISLLLPFAKEFLEKRQEEKKYITEDARYSKKQYFMTTAEHHVFDQLLKIAGEKYHVFPQVHYSKIMYAEGQQNFHNPWFNKIDRKSADFVLFDKHDISPVLVIEHDDKTHNRKDRIERDDFIDHTLEKSGISIVHVRPFATEEELKKLLQVKISI